MSDLQHLKDVAPWVSFIAVTLLFLWRMAVFRLDVRKYHDEKLGGYADRIEERLDRCETERDDLRKSQTEDKKKILLLEQEIELVKLQMQAEYDGR